MLGYTLDLDNQCASIAEKNVLRCIYGGFLIEEREGTISILFREIVVFGVVENLPTISSVVGVECSQRGQIRQTF